MRVNVLAFFLFKFISDMSGSLMYDVSVRVGVHHVTEPI